MKNKKLKLIVMTAVFAAVIYVATMFIKVPMPLSGYAHLGDAFIFLAASILPLPYAMAAGAIGAGIADFTSPYAIWTIATIIIKPLVCIAFTSKKEKIINARNIAAPIIGSAVTILLYSVYALFITKDATFMSAFLPQVITCSIQCALCVPAYYIFAFALDKTNLKNRITKL